MIGGQYRDITGDTEDLAALHRLKTGRLFSAAVRAGLEVARVPAAKREPWLAFGDEIGLLFQVVDDLLDGDGYAERLGPDAAGRVGGRVRGTRGGTISTTSAKTRRCSVNWWQALH